MRRFGGESGILNRQVLINGENTSIIGVMPPDFRFTDENGDYLAPLPLNHFQLRGSARFVIVAAKLKPGVSMRQAQSEMDAVAGQLARDFPERDTDHGKPWTIRLQPVREALFGVMSRPLLLLQAAVGFVLLIACANVAALLLARAASRSTEVAIRAALGASRGRIFRQFLTESLLLSLFGGILGVALAWEGVQVLVAMAPAWLPRLHAIRVDGRVLLFTTAISILTGLIFGVIPATLASKLTLADSLKNVTRGGTAGGARNRLRAVLVAAQLAMALMLLIGSGLLIRSFLALQGADLGCQPRGLLTFRYSFPEKRFGKPVGMYHGFPLWEMSAEPPVFFTQVLERIKTVPGVRSSAGIVYPPMTGNYPLTFTIEGRTVANADDLTADFFPVTPNFFGTMKIAMLRGRDFTDRDVATAPWVAIVNETMARRFFPGENPIGKHIRVDLSQEDPMREIIAVVKDIPASNPQTKQDPAIFTPFLQEAAHSSGPNTSLHLEMTFLLRTAGDPMSAAARGAARGARNQSQPADDRSANRGILPCRPGSVSALLFDAFGPVCAGGNRAGRGGDLRSNGVRGGAAHAGNRNSHGSRRRSAGRAHLDGEPGGAGDRERGRRGYRGSDGSDPISFLRDLGSEGRRSRDFCGLHCAVGGNRDIRVPGSDAASAAGGPDHRAALRVGAGRSRRS